MNSQSQTFFSQAQECFVGGVNSPVRAFAAVGGAPLFMARGEGSVVWDVDGQRYIDYVCSWGPLAVGHGHPQVIAAAERALRDGCSFGAPTRAETELAQCIQHWMPNMERMRFVNSGTEATMSALRVARGFTKRDKIIKFEGCYHGHADALLVQAGSGALTLGSPNSGGVPQGATQDTIVVHYNDIDAVAQAFAAYPGEIAAVIVEPVAGNMGYVEPLPDFLPALREHCDTHGALLIFDEVMTGFRVALGGAQAHYHVRPDLTCLGKVIGGGMPVGAYGGRAEIMECLAPMGAVYQAGTLSGNPVAMASGLATLRELTTGDHYAHACAMTGRLVDGLRDGAERAGCSLQISSLGTMWGMSFQQDVAIDLRTAQQRDTACYAKLFHGMLSRGVYLAPSAFEAGFVSTVHRVEDIDATVAAFADSLRECVCAA